MKELIRHWHQAVTRGKWVCGKSVYESYYADQWDHVTCKECLEFNAHKFKKHITYISCKKCGLVKGSGYAKCEP